MVTVNVPGLALPLPVNVSTDVPVPPDDIVTGEGLKAALTPKGGLAENETVPLNPFKLPIVMVVEAVPLFDMLRLEGDALMLKSGGGGGETVSEYKALWDRFPLVPVIVIVYVPVGVLVVVEIVNWLVKVGIPFVGFSPVVSPVADGEIDADKLTGWVVPLSRLTVTVEDIELPWMTEPLAGVTPTE